MPIADVLLHSAPLARTRLDDQAATAFGAGRQSREQVLGARRPTLPGVRCHRQRCSAAATLDSERNGVRSAATALLVIERGWAHAGSRVHDLQYRFRSIPISGLPKTCRSVASVTTLLSNPACLRASLQHTPG